jgi:CHASE2 domain-containing sensor protein
LIAVFAVAFEMREDLLSNLGFGECDRVDTAATLLYQRYATTEFRKPRTHYVRLAVLSSQTVAASVLKNACQKREYVANLLRNLAKLGPSVIAIDFAYPPDLCTDKEDKLKSASLHDAISDVSKTIPIVMVASSKSAEELTKDPDLDQLLKGGLTSRSLIADPHFPFDGTQLTYGMAKVGCDKRRVPLFWWVYPNKEAVLNKTAAPEPHAEPSFAYETARTYDSELQKTLANSISANRHPFISFIPEDGFRQIDLRLLDDPAHTDEVQKMLRGKIVLIAENSDREDQYNTVIGTVPGYLLHANYIEALLDDRYFSPTSPYVELPLAILGIFLIVVIFEVSDELKSVPATLRPVVGFGFASVFVAAVFILCSAWRIYFGRELIFWVPLLPLPVIEAIYSWRVQAKGRPHD